MISKEIVWLDILHIDPFLQSTKASTIELPSTGNNKINRKGEACQELHDLFRRFFGFVCAGTLTTITTIENVSVKEKYIYPMNSMREMDFISPCNSNTNNCP